MKLRLPLVVKVTLTLVAVGLLPLAISFFQLRTNQDALLAQVQRTHMVAAATAAQRIDAYAGALGDLARSLASSSVLVADARAGVAQELLRGTLQARPEVAAIGVYSSAGERVVLAQRLDLSGELPGFDEAVADSEVVARRPTVVDGVTGRWLRLVEALPDEVGWLLVVADGAQLALSLRAPELGDEARLALVERDGGMLIGRQDDLAEIPREVLAAATSARLGAGSNKYRGSAGTSVVVGHAAVPDTSWVVVSRQPARVAEVAASRIRRATWVAVVGALLLAGLLAWSSWTSLIRPLRRLVREQRELAGADPERPSSGSEIADLEASFALLQQRVRDREEIGKVFLGRYQVTEVIGAGAMGMVFRGWDPKLERPIAVKTMRLSVDEYDREKLVRTLVAEAAVSARFNHPNIVTVYDLAEEGSSAFIAMELVEGCNLEDYLAEHGTLGEYEVIPLGAAIAEALAAAHEQGLVHHDVKPANVLLGDDDSVKVTDFGISRLIASAAIAEEIIRGTPGYLAPECVAGEGYRPASDLFALGVVLYECLAGEHPFLGPTLRETIVRTMTDEAPALTGIEPRLWRLIEGLLIKQPADRMGGARVVAAELADMAAAKGLRWRRRTGTGMAASAEKRRSRLLSIGETRRLGGIGPATP